MSEFIPCTPAGQSRWTQLSALDGVTYQLTFRWSQRDGRWLLDVADDEGTALRSCLAPNTNAPLLRGCIAEGRPAGELLIVDTTGANDLDPGFDDLGAPGARFVLMYVTAAELAA